MKSYTDIEQSKTLAKILPIESADMRYSPLGDNMHPWVWADTFIEKDAIPCWSLAALLEQLDDNAGIAKDYGFWFCYDNRKSLYTKHYDNPIDACYEMIVKLHELKLL